VETTNTNVPGITSPSMLDKVSQHSVGLHCYCGLRSLSFFFLTRWLRSISFRKAKGIPRSKQYKVQG
jgi:hypothetical protein